MLRSKFIRRLLLFLLLFTFIYLILGYSPLFKIKKVVVSGNKIVDSQWIIDVASNNHFENLFLLSRRKARKVLINEIPQLKKIKFSKHWFENYLKIKVVERSPFASIICYPNNYLIDEDGVIININKDKNVVFVSEYSNLPIITGIPPESIKGLTVLPTEYSSLIKGTLKILIRIFKDTGLKFNLTNPQDIRVLTNDLLEIKFGDERDFKKKLKTLKTLVKAISEKNEKVEYIDVRYPDYPVVKYFNQ
ncbi:MAG: cell division protein FtsQ/DivIB [Candidatus Margulisbacteria bacterium]|nr:cell division protein FtsQ/DivIB [Candidatus Margulisiibacteriota bacterium]